MELTHGLEVQRAGDPVDTVYFVESGVVSLVVFTGDGHAVESGMIGREGAVNSFEALHELPAFGLATVQVAGHGLGLNAAHLRTVAHRDWPTLDALMRAHSIFMVQARQSAACNATHVLEARLARWLLQTYDRVGSPTLALTQEFMAVMLGVQRTSVTATIGNLSALGLVENQRGMIKILDLPGLKEVACDCYEIINNYTDRLNGN